jgi:uncharacterized membrane protein YagU involved in acid resistance
MLGSKTLILTSTYPAELSPADINQRHRLRRRFFLGLHLVGLVTALLSIALFAAAIPRWNANFFHSRGPNRGDWTDGMPLAPLTVAFIFHVVVVAQSSLRKSRYAEDLTHGYTFSRCSVITHMVLPILVLASLFPALILAAYGSLFRFWQPAVHTQSGILLCNMLNVFTRECAPALYHIGALQIGGIVFGIAVWTIHFVLLLVGLRNWRRSRLAKQLQQEKIAGYAPQDAQRSPPGIQKVSSGNARTSDGRLGARAKKVWNHKIGRQAGSSLPSQRCVRSETGNSVSYEAEVPVVLVEAPLPSLPPISQRS